MFAIIGGVVRIAAQVYVTRLAANAADAVFEQGKKECKDLMADLSNNKSHCQAEFVSACLLQPEKGDLIEIERQPYSHWAIYVGNGQVIHLTCLANEKEYKYIYESLEQAVGSALCRVNNLHKAACIRGLVARDVEVIVKAAFAKEGYVEKDYQIFDNNCEHFVTECRFGHRFSIQGELAKVDRPIIKMLGPIANKIVNASAQTIQPYPKIIKLSGPTNDIGVRKTLDNL